ncbi:MAG: iron ABC transporter permease, partial [Clostridiales Family XIII bacterium]|nr:iron ABC transporter permease [Clostridiales Family XIII bacterium]
MRKRSFAQRDRAGNAFGKAAPRFSVADGADFGLRRNPRRIAGWFLAFFLLLVLCVFASILIGSRNVGLSDVAAALGGSVEGFARGAVAKRVPRTLLAVVVGAALATSGAVM